MVDASFFLYLWLVPIPSLPPLLIYVFPPAWGRVPCLMEESCLPVGASAALTHHPAWHNRHKTVCTLCPACVGRNVYMRKYGSACSLECVCLCVSREDFEACVIFQADKYENAWQLLHGSPVIFHPSIKLATGHTHTHTHEFTHHANVEICWKNVMSFIIQYKAERGRAGWWGAGWERKKWTWHLTKPVLKSDGV